MYYYETSNHKGEWWPSASLYKPKIWKDADGRPYVGHYGPPIRGIKHINIMHERLTLDELQTVYGYENGR